MITTLEHKVLECMDRKSAASPVVVYEDAVVMVTIDWLYDAYKQFGTEDGRFYRVHLDNQFANEGNSIVPLGMWQTAEVPITELLNAIRRALQLIRTAYTLLYRDVDKLLTES